MITELLLSVAILRTAQPQQQVEQQLQRQQTQLDRVHQEMQQQVQQLERLHSLLAEQERQRSMCTAEIRWVNGSDPRALPPTVNSAVQMNLFSTISKPTDLCVPAEIRVTASYLDAGQNLVCSGVIENLAVQTSPTQSVNLEIRPWNLREFGRWRNEPPAINSGAKRLLCFNPEGTAEATPEELARVKSVKVRATVLPGRGGLATAEFEIRIR